MTDLHPRTSIVGDVFPVDCDWFSFSIKSKNIYIYTYNNVKNNKTSMTSAQLNSCPLYISIFHPLFGSTQPLNSLCNVTPPGWSWAKKKSPHEPTMLLVAPWRKMEKITYTLEDERLVHLQPSPMKRKEIDLNHKPAGNSVPAVHLQGLWLVLKIFQLTVRFCQFPV